MTDTNEDHIAGAGKKVGEVAYDGRAGARLRRHLNRDKWVYHGSPHDPKQDLAALLAEVDRLREALASPTPTMIEAACEARNMVPGTVWTDGITEGVAAIERMLAEKMIQAAARTSMGGEHGQ